MAVIPLDTKKVVTTPWLLRKLGFRPKYLTIHLVDGRDCPYCDQWGRATDYDHAGTWTYTCPHWVQAGHSIFFDPPFPKRIKL